MDKVKCAICGKKFAFVGAHIRVHNIKADEYHKLYPDAKIGSDEYLNNRNKLRGESLRGKPAPFLREGFDKNRRQEIIDRAAKSRTGQKRTDEAKQKMSDNHWSKTQPEAFKAHIKKYWGASAGAKGYAAVRKTRYEFDGIYFMSKIEVNIYKKLRKFGLSKKEINHDFRIKNCRVDFFPMKKFFWEHHPTFHIDRETDDEYRLRRRKLLDDNGYSEYDLIITKTYKDVNDFIKQKLKNYDTHGKVQTVYS